MPSITLIAIVGGVVAALAVVGAIVSRYKVSDPDEALIISGSKSKEADGGSVPSRVVLGGGGVFVWPFVQKSTSMSLETRQIAWTVRESPSSQNILVNLEGVANVKVGGDERAVRDAAERFNVNPKNIEDFVTQNIEGDMRAIVGTMTVEEINSDRETLKDRVLRVTGEACAEWGLVLEGLNIQSVTTPSGYINDLGRIEAAAVRRNAEIAEANTQRESEEAKAKAQQAIADANRELTLRVAEIKQDTDTAEAKANSAGPIAAAEQQVLVFEQERIAEQKRAEVTEMRLASEVSKPADARAYATRVEADAMAAARVAKAEADAKAERLEGESEAAANQARGNADAAVAQRRGEADAAVTKARGLAEAEAEAAKGDADGSAIKARGEAEAGVIKARGLAEAAGVDAKKQAYENYPQAGLIDLTLEGLPSVVRESAKPIGDIDSLTVVSTDGASKVTQMSTDALSQGIATIKALTGVDLADVLQKVAAGAGTSEDEVPMGDFGAARAALAKAEGDKK
ncbi:flotillin family protein [Demequina sp. NBRC 110054]|uniref:flotillin family protein n=1 Tax=Demequina sp. NBRC 110054 TaxID=1570343 RepID=UPI0009FC1047|nr:flotillin family protein [Demequina sp. NBRC 110054]